MARFSAVLVVSLLVSGCAFTAQRANLSPQVEVPPSSIGNGGAVFVDSTDERASDVLGVRGGQGIGAQISAHDVDSVVNSALVLGLNRLGFSPTLQKTPDIPELRVEIRALEYKVTTGFWAGGMDVNAALKGICVLGERRPYEKLYRGHHKETILVVQSEAENDSYINDALSQAINSLLADQELMRCLAQSAAAQRTAPPE